MTDTSQDVAIIAMAGRFPQAPDVNELWRCLAEGRECISRFSEEELSEAGIWDFVRDIPGFVPARAIMDRPEYFDAGFFGFSPSEAKLTDPQHRVFLEVSWEALERAGYDPTRYDGLIGVYAGVDVSSYAAGQLAVWTHDLVKLIGNDKDYMASRVAYKLDLRGPAVMVQTACSTSLVAVQHACQSLLSYQCDMALAGGVGIAFPQKGGYVFQEGGILSPDGHCRAFDEQARGTVGGDGCGIVVLKRFDEAVTDGDHIHALIKAAAINNDGADKIGYTAPSVRGQSEVIAMTQAMAGVHPDTIGYVEAHGTGTQLGDPIEVAALTEVFRSKTDRRGFCALGSLKSNTGHMNSAAGVGSLIKAALCLERGQIPASLHFESPNPALDLESSPFFVPTRLMEWERGDHPRRAAVSSFGVGGTNAHAVLEEAPELEPSGTSRPVQPLLLTARSPEALDQATVELRAHLLNNPTEPLADVAFTLLCGRRRFEHRRLIVAGDTAAASSALASLPEAFRVDAARRSVMFLFPGQGAQYPGMTRGLYEHEPAYRTVVDNCCEYLTPRIGVDLRTLILGDADNAQELNQTAHTQPALFVVEYALAQLLGTWGVRPTAMMGHSVGEYVAACMAGVFTLHEGLDLLAARGRLIQDMPGGGMLAVSLSEHEAVKATGLTVAGQNAPDVTVLSGPDHEVDEAVRGLERQGVPCTRLHTSHAFHSAMMDPMLDRFRAEVEKLSLHAPSLPFVSNVTGTWITDEDAVDPSYWVQHLRRAVRFSDGVRLLLTEPDPLFVEVGPGRNLTGLVTRHAPELKGRVVTTVRHPRDDQDDVEIAVGALGRLYAEGADVDWAAYYGAERRLRLPLPTYPFQRERYWEEGPATLGVLEASPRASARIEDWVTTPSWQRTLPTAQAPDSADRGTLLVLAGESVGRFELVERIAKRWEQAIEIRIGSDFKVLAADRVELDPIQPDHWTKLLETVPNEGPITVLHLWSLDGREEFEPSQERGLFTLLRVAQALSDRDVEIVVATRGSCDVTGVEDLRPDVAPILGAARVLPQEFAGIRCRVVDTRNDEDLLAGLLGEIGRDGPTHVAYRGGQRWIEVYAPAGDALPVAASLRDEGVYMITGGLGTIGLALAEDLSRRFRARLVLTSRTGLVARADWDDWLSSHRDDDPQSQRIKRIRAMEEAGAEVEVLNADVADAERMAYVLDRTRERFGQLHGVIHAAGDAGQRVFRAAKDTEPEHCATHFRANVQGTNVLAALLSPDIDFVLLVSSLSTTVGGTGLLAYSAANQYLDTFAASKGAPWISVGLDAWAPAQNSALAGMGIPVAQGIELLERIVSRPDAPRWVVAATPHARRRAAASRGSRPVGQARPTAAAAERHARPDLANAFVAPRNDVERAVAGVWEEVLGISGIGVEDNFFKLGGDSLMAIQIGTRLGEVSGVQIPINELFEDATIAAVARAVSRARDAGASPSDVLLRRPLDDQLALVESLSDEEVRRLLAEVEAGT